LLPDDAREKPMTGRVLGFGPGKRGPDGKPVPMGFKEGDEVMFGKYAGTEVDLEGSTYLFITSEDVLCTVDRNGKQEPKPEVQAAAPEPIKEEPKVEVKPEEVTAEVK
jgi:chaperonin GroES